jgi:tetratricopeptide (TPR) repeat protein
LGQIAALNGNQREAQTAWLNGIQAVRARSRQRVELADSMPFVALISQKSENGEDVSALVAEARELFPSQLTIQLFDANLAVRNGKPLEAVAMLERLSAIDPNAFYDPDTSYKKSLFSYHAREGLGLCYYRLERYQDAVRQFELAAAAATDESGACLLMARLARAKAQSTVTESARH